ncbi:MAG: hypothetical protein WAT39_08570 [Planctomycetota bacterium]
MRHLVAIAFLAASPLLTAQSAVRADATPPPPAEVGPQANEPLPLQQAAPRPKRLLDRVHFDQPRPEAPLWAVGRAWKASFDPTGCTVVPFFGSMAPDNFPLRLELAQVRVDGEPLPLAPGQPAHDGQVVRTARGPLTEVVATALDSLEQSFVFERLPARGAIAVDVRCTGAYTTSVIDGGLRFANDHGHVDYTKAVAVDARGDRLALPIAWTGEAARIEIPAAWVATAALPIVLDPILNFWFLLGSAAPAGQTQHDSDVASFQSLGGRTLMIWQRQWSATDQDCWGLVFDGNLGLVQTDFAIDFTPNDWLKVACAANNYAQNFLVVSQVRIGLQHFIAGRTIAANGVLGAVFDIEREGVVGTPGNNFHPDVGSDPYFGPGRYTVVFQKKYLFAADIYMRQITTGGGLVTTNPVALATLPEEEQRPAISKSCGQSNGLPANWLVTWQRTWPGAPYDQEVHGRFVGWNGALVGGTIFVATTVAEETGPSPGSPIDANGQRFWPVVHELASAPGQPRDLQCKLVRSDGAVTLNAGVGSGIPAADHADVEVDSDGTRFVAVYTLNGTQEEQHTLAFLPGTNTLRTESRTGLGTSGADTKRQCNVCADYSGGSAMTPRYVISFTHVNTNTFNLVAFGGHTGSANSFTYRGIGCSNLPITATGSSVIGQTLTVTVGNGALSGTIFGFPDSISLAPLGCNCLQGVALGAIYGGNPLVWTVPNNPIYVGIDLSVQGFTIAGNQCLNLFDISDTIDFRVR